MSTDHGVSFQPASGIPPETALLETMRAEKGEVPLLHLHLERLAHSARDWGFAFDSIAVARALLTAGATGETRKLRLRLWRDGRYDVTGSPLTREAWTTVAVYPEPIEEAGTWRCICKTTARDHYDRAIAWAAGVGVDEPILINARGDVMEGARTNVFVRRGDALLTPPLAAGGLGGVMRQRLIDDGATETPLAPEDLSGADAILIVNSVRGEMPVNLIIPGA